MITNFPIEHPWLSPTALALLVVLFVAPALLLAVATRRPLFALLAGAGISAGIELVQAVVPAIGRSCDTNDWTSNTIGAAIGVALGWVTLRISSARSETPMLPERSRTS